MGRREERGASTSSFERSSKTAHAKRIQMYDSITNTSHQIFSSREDSAHRNRDRAIISTMSVVGHVTGAPSVEWNGGSALRVHSLAVRLTSNEVRENRNSRSRRRRSRFLRACCRIGQVP